MERAPTGGTKDCPDYRALLERELEGAGFFTWGFLDKKALSAVLADCGTDPSVRRRYGIDEAEGLAVVALRYGEGEFPAPSWAGSDTFDPDETASVELARFARANWYGEILARLGGAVQHLVEKASQRGLDPPPPKRWKRLSNSPLPERLLALAAGLGVLGKNGLLIAEPRSANRGAATSAILIGLLVCPANFGEAPSAASSGKNTCASCNACIEACPTNALREGEGFQRKLCLQNWTARDLDPPPAVEERMGSILYGCDRCLESCPHFLTDPGAHTDLGILGPRLPARFFLEKDDAEIRGKLSETALGLSWMSCGGFRRSASRAVRLRKSPH